LFADEQKYPRVSDYNIYTDQQLIELLSCGDRRAFDCLYSRHWFQLYQSAYWILKDSDASKDIVQEVFIWLWEKRESSSIDNVSAYLKAAVRFKVANYIRSGNTRQDLFERLAKFRGAQVAATCTELIELKELRKVIDETVGRLPNKCREIYRLSREEYLSNHQIANRLGISVKTVENQMTIALRRIREKLDLHLLFILILHITS
jgi:RNA polymerase sigma-70 factor (family 1)